MKVIKRNGKEVYYDKSKIELAISKANAEVEGKQKATQKQIEKIIEYIESLNKKRILVEDIQDIIEQKLMEFKKFELAKKYIVYRYTRALVRKANKTDESILSIIRNENRDLTPGVSNRTISIASTQRDFIAGQVSKDITQRILLPEKIIEAHDRGVLYFHDMDYFIQPIFNSCLVNIEDMLDNGTVMNGKMIESPKSFQVACTVTTQIIAAVASNQYGGQSIDISHLGKYLRVSRDKFLKKLNDKYKGKIDKKIIESIVDDRVKEELSSGVQTMQYQINTLMTTTGQAPSVTLFLRLADDDPYIEENAMIIEEIINQRYEGIKNEDGLLITPIYPKLVYVLDENNCLNGGKYDYLTTLALKCSSKRLYPDFISAKKMREIYNGNVFSPMGCTSFLSPYKDSNNKYKFEGRFNQGIISLNLPRIAIESKNDIDKFWELLEERLDLCYEALMCRYHSLLGTYSDTSPIHWQHGAISRLEKGEVIDKLLKNGYSTLSLGYVGIHEVVKYLTKETIREENGKKFALKIMKTMIDSCNRWKKETGLGFVLCGVESPFLGCRFLSCDKEEFGIIKDVTDKDCYSNSYHIDGNDIDVFERLKLEGEFQDLTSGGSIIYLDVPDKYKSLEDLETILKYAYENVLYVEFNSKYDYCHACGYEGKFNEENNELVCPKCGNKDRNKMDIIRKNCGYSNDMITRENSERIFD